MGALTLSLPLLSWILLLVLPGVPFAQQIEPPPEAQAAATTEGIEEIVVTARKRQEALQEVPITITAFSESDLQDYGFETARDIARATPNLQIKTGFGNVNPTIFLRGVGINDFTANANGAVGVYVDEVYTASPAVQLFQMFDLEQVSVLKGPQGTLYGRNTTGGAINFVSKKPSGDFNFKSSLTYGGEYDQFDVEGALGFPILEERLSGRIAFVRNQGEGWMKNSLDGDKLNDRDNWAARLLFLFTPSDSMEWLLKLYGGQNRSGATQFQSQGLIPTEGGQLGDLFGYVEDPNPWRGAFNRDGREELDLFGASLTGTWELDDVVLTSITSYDQNDRRTDEETDASPNRLVEIIYANESWQFAQELRVASATDDPWQWLVGAYFFHEDLEVDNLTDILGELRPILGFDPENFVVAIRSKFDQQNTSWALFGQSTVEIAADLALTLGARYTWEKKDIDVSSGFHEAGEFLPVFNLNDKADERWGELTGRASLDYAVREDVLLFASYSRGFKSGGFNGASPTDPSFDPEFLDAYEIGAKTSWWNNRIQLNLGAFYYDYKDLQVFTLTTFQGQTLIVLDNAADAEIYGVDVDLRARPLPGLDLQLGLGILDTEYEDFIAGTGQDFSGNTMVAAPDWNLNAAIAYELPLGEWGTLRPMLDATYIDEVFFDSSNADRLGQGGYWIVNGRLALTSLDDRMELALWARNLGNKRYRVDTFDISQIGFDEISVGPPRMLGLTLTYRYD